MKKFTLVLLLLILGISFSFSQGTMTAKWKVSATKYSFFKNDHTVRSIAYNQATKHLLVATRTPTHLIYILNAETGDSLGVLNMTGVTGGTYNLNCVTVTDDGVIYAGNLATSSAGSFNLYKWSSETAVPKRVYSGPPSPLDGSGRFGDAMAVSGTGTSTKVYVGGTALNYVVAILTPGTTNPDTMNVTTVSLPILTIAGAPTGYPGVYGISPVGGTSGDFWVNSASAGTNVMRVTSAGIYVDSVSFKVAPDFTNSVTYVEIGTKKYLLITDAGTPSARVVDVTSGGFSGGVSKAALRYTTGILGTNSNINGTGICAFDKVNKIMFVASTNNAIAAYAIDSLVNVTFNCNVATIKDTVTGRWWVNLRGDTPFSWDENSPKMTNTDGDYWKTTIAAPFNKHFYYKFYVDNSKTGTEGAGWESSFIKTAALDNWDTRVSIVGTRDTVLPIEFFNKYNGDWDRAYTPLKHGADSVAVLFRVNMKSLGPDFNPALHLPIVRGDLVGPDWDWNKNLVLKREGTEAVAADLWSAVLVMPKTKFGDRQFKFFVINKADSLNTGWSFGRVKDEDNNRTFTLKGDTTLQWAWWNNTAAVPFTGKDTVIVNWTADLSSAIRNKSYSSGDTVYVQYGFFSSGKSADPKLSGTDAPTKKLNRTGIVGNIYKASDTVITQIGTTLYYQYYLTKNATDYREVFFNFDYKGSTQNLAERRGITPAKTTNIFDTVISLTSGRRQPLFRNQTKLSKAVTVTLSLDLRPAYYSVLAGAVLDDIQGTQNVNKADSVYAWGVWANGPMTNGWTGWGGTLRDSAAKKMFDDGTHGDTKAGDRIYAQQFQLGPQFSDGREKIGQEFKFGIGGGDNESGFGLNHIENIDDASSTFTLNTQFGSINPSRYFAWDFNNQVPKTITKNFVLLKELWYAGKIAQGLIFKPGKILDNGNTIWICGHESAGNRDSYVFLSTDAGATWKQSAKITGRVSNVDAMSKTVGFVGTADGSILKTTDGGTTWVTKHTYVLSGGPGSGFFDGIKVVGDSVVVGMGDGENGADLYFCRSNDKGETFKVIPTANIQSYGQNMYGYFSYGNCVDGYDKNIWFATYGNSGTNGYIIKSTDAGQTWKSVELTMANRRFNAISFASATYGYGVDNVKDLFFTTDGGNTWTKTATKPVPTDGGTATITAVNGIPGTKSCIALGITANGTNYTSGAFSSADQGATWTQIPAPPTASGQNLCSGLFLNENTGFGLSYGGYVLKLGTGTPTAVKDPVVSVPNEYKLEQNYPNPFNPTTTINYNIPVNTKVTLKIYNSLGQEVKTLVDNQAQEAGKYSVTFNATNLASGVYFYHITADNFRMVKKMVLLK